MNISAIIPAAGKSVRMGQPKMLMPWGSTTVLGKVIQTLQAAGVEDIIVVTNSKIAPQVTSSEFRVVLNDDGEMLESIQLGLQALLPPPSLQDTYHSLRSGTLSPIFSENGGGQEGVLICLGDQPQVGEESVRKVCDGFRQSGSQIVVPSYQMRRGHPWLIVRELWSEILHLRAPQSMRDFLNVHKDEIFYVECNSPSILQDLDTPADYLKYRP
jgi:molybdenum cofactor cytidylyltransferase